MLVRWLIAALLAFAATSVSMAQEHLAAVGWGLARMGGFVGTPPQTSLAVYPGCTQPPNAPGSYATSKAWYFNPNPSIGHPPAYYDGIASFTPGSGGPTGNTNYATATTTGGSGTGATVYVNAFNGTAHDVLPNFTPSQWVAAGYHNGDVITVNPASIGGMTGVTFTYRTPDAQSTWGDSAHPFDNLSSISGMFGFEAWAVGWGGTGTYQVLSGISWYNSHSSAIVRDFDCFDPGTPGCTNPLETNDPNHYRLWPGDTIYLQGDSTYNWLASGQGMSFGISLGGLNNYSDNFVDASGNPVWVWIKADPAKPNPKVYSVNLAGGLNGIIVQGLNVSHVNSKITSTHPANALPFQSLGQEGVAVPSSGAVTLQLGAAGDTINELWTYVTSVSGADQILINGSWLDLLYNTYNEFLADATIPSVMPATLNGTAFGFTWKVGAGTTTTVPFTLQFSSHQTSVVSGSTYVVNGTTYTAGTDFTIGASLAATYTNFVSAMATLQPTVTIGETQPSGIELTSPLYGIAGAHLIRFTGITEPEVLHGVAATLPATFPYGMNGDNQIAVTGSHTNPVYNVIIDSNNVSSYDAGEPYSGLYANYFPQGGNPNNNAAGSLGYNVETGAHGAPGGPWNVWDVNAQESNAIYVGGNYWAGGGPNKSSTQIDGATCVAVTNNYVHHAFTLEFADAKNGLAQGNIVNWSMNDSYDSYGAIYTNWTNNIAMNLIYGENSVHSDGFQSGTGPGFTLADMQNPAYFPSAIGYPGIFAPQVHITRHAFYGTTDPAIVSNSFHDMFNQVVTMANSFVPWGQMSEGMIDMIFADNLLYGAGEVQCGLCVNSTFANNTGLLPGNAVSTLGGNSYVGLKLEINTVQPLPAGNIIVNNLLNALQVYGGGVGTPCASRGDTFATNLLIPMVNNGTPNSTITYTGCANSTSGVVSFAQGGSTNKGAESCGVIINPQPGVAGACGFPTIPTFAPGLVQEYDPTDTGMYDPTTLNGQPPGYPSSPSGPLVCLGTAGANVPTTNRDGQPWAGGTGCIGIGAY